MSMFRKPEPGDNSNGKQEKPEKKSTWQLMLDHLSAAERHLQEFQNLLSITGFDFQKPLDYITMRRDSLVKAIEEAGGVVEQQPAIEDQIRDYLPKVLREKEPQP